MPDDPGLNDPELKKQVVRLYDSYLELLKYCSITQSRLRELFQECRCQVDRDGIPCNWCQFADDHSNCGVPEFSEMLKREKE